MNNIAKVTMRLANLTGSQTTRKVFQNSFAKRDFTRSLWHMSKTPEATSAGILSVHKPSMNCSCGCGGMQQMHTKAEKELVEFLTEEILAERKAHKGKNIVNTLDGYNVTYNGAEVELSKQGDKEKVVINFNVNHTVDADEQPEVDPNADKVDMLEMRSKPQFEVDIVKGGTTLSFTCSFLEGEPQEGEYNDVFGIDELTIYEGEWNDKVYAVAGDVLDGYLYDLLMNILEEKGVTNEFAEKLSDLATAYEHGSYIGLLEKLSKFTTGK